ncbi:ROK family transcriptional regulator [Aureibacillus halotolerans]|uniref:MarR family transcriptional regulator n=1 Tax=Aureibacillus halotolerans TaxID=1508390 RepID=A0A4R6U9T6_9BACI|nr:ROK family transcriptional regulator [Aureibacillus halotolerans]TDQ41455.1 MarR family transcriptional regulator [Aureibacillus halotolerans]
MSTNTTKPLGSFERMKSMNRSTVLNTIRLHAPLSRADIAKSTQLTPPTVGNLVKELLAERFVRETNIGPSSGGRKPTMLELDPTYHCCIGLDISSTTIKGVLCTLLGDCLHTAKQPLPSNCTTEELLQTAYTVTDLLLEKKQVDQKLHGIGIAMHGLVDVEQGISLFAPNLGLHNIQIRERFQIRYDTNVMIDNDARAMALGESWFGQGKTADSSVLINIGRGVGAGIVLQQRLQYGADDVSGEIGHMVISEDGPLCSCGQRGCLQAYISGPAIASIAESQLDDNASSPLRSQKKPLTGLDVYTAYQKGDALAEAVFVQAGKRLGIALVNIIHTLNPSLIILGGGVSLAGNILLPPAIDIVKRRGLTQKAKETTIVLSTLKEKAASIGAVTLLLESLFQERF